MSRNLNLNDQTIRIELEHEQKKYQDGLLDQTSVPELSPHVSSEQSAYSFSFIDSISNVSSNLFKLVY